MRFSIDLFSLTDCAVVDESVHFNFNFTGECLNDRFADSDVDEGSIPRDFYR